MFRCQQERDRNRMQGPINMDADIWHRTMPDEIESCDAGFGVATPAGKANRQISYTPVSGVHNQRFKVANAREGDAPMID